MIDDAQIQDVATKRWFKPRMGMQENWVKARGQATRLGPLDLSHWLDVFAKQKRSVLVIEYGKRLGVLYVAGKIRRKMT